MGWRREWRPTLRPRAGTRPGGSYEGADSRDVAADEQRLDRLGALERVDRLDVGQVPHHVVLQQDAVAAEQVARLGQHLASLAGVVQLRQRGDGVGQIVALLEPPEP